MKEMKILRTDKIEKNFSENKDVDDRFPLEMCNVVVHYKKHKNGTEEMGIYLIDSVYPSVVNGVFLDSVYETSKNYYTDNIDGKWKKDINRHRFDCELKDGEKYFIELEGIWEKFKEAKDKREFIRNLFKEA